MFSTLVLYQSVRVDVLLLIKIKTQQGPCNTHVVTDDIKAGNKLFWQQAVSLYPQKAVISGHKKQNQKETPPKH